MQAAVEEGDRPGVRGGLLLGQCRMGWVCGGRGSWGGKVGGGGGSDPHQCAFCRFFRVTFFHVCFHDHGAKGGGWGGES